MFFICANLSENLAAMGSIEKITEMSKSWAGPGVGGRAVPLYELVKFSAGSICSALAALAKI